MSFSIMEYPLHRQCLVDHVVSHLLSTGLPPLDCMRRYCMLTRPSPNVMFALSTVQRYSQEKPSRQHRSVQRPDLCFGIEGRLRGALGKPSMAVPPRA